MLVTHDLDQAARMADWVVRLDEAAGGRAGPGEELLGGLAMTSSSIDVSLGEVAATLVLVAIAVAVSFWRRADLEEDIGIAVVRSFIQLTAIGYVIKFIFDQDSLWFVVALIAGDGGVRRAHRARRGRSGCPDAFGPLLVALALAAAATLGARGRARRLRAEPRYLVPVGGMVVGNSMTAAAVALNRLGDEVPTRAREIEATLALGATATPGDAADPSPQPALGDDPADRLDQDHRADLLPRHDGRDAARRRRARPTPSACS